jgi:hypothetical protein
MVGAVLKLLNSFSAREALLYEALKKRNKELRLDRDRRADVREYLMGHQSSFWLVHEVLKQPIYVDRAVTGGLLACTC